MDNFISFLNKSENLRKGYINSLEKADVNFKKKWLKCFLLPSNSGMSHAKISASQRARRRKEGFNTSIEHEFKVGYQELINAGVNKKQAQKAIRRAYKYFDSIGAFRI